MPHRCQKSTFLGNACACTLTVKGRTNLTSKTYIDNQILSAYIRDIASHNGESQTFDTYTAIASQTISGDVDVLFTLGYSTTTDAGGARYVRVTPAGGETNDGWYAVSADGGVFRLQPTDGVNRAVHFGVNKTNSAAVNRQILQDMYVNMPVDPDGTIANSAGGLKLSLKHADNSAIEIDTDLFFRDRSQVFITDCYLAAADPFTGTYLVRFGNAGDRQVYVTLRDFILECNHRADGMFMNRFSFFTVDNLQVLHQSTVGFETSSTNSNGELIMNKTMIAEYLYGEPNWDTPGARTSTGMIINNNDNMFSNTTVRYCKTSIVIGAGAQQFINNHIYQGPQEIGELVPGIIVNNTIVADPLLKNAFVMLCNNYIDNCTIELHYASNLILSNTMFLTNFDDMVLDAANTSPANQTHAFINLVADEPNQLLNNVLITNNEVRKSTTTGFMDYIHVSGPGNFDFANSNFRKVRIHDSSATSPTVHVRGTRAAIRANIPAATQTIVLPTDTDLIWDPSYVQSSTVIGDGSNDLTPSLTMHDKTSTSVTLYVVPHQISPGIITNDVNNEVFVTCGPTATSYYAVNDIVYLRSSAVPEYSTDIGNEAVVQSKGVNFVRLTFPTVGSSKPLDPSGMIGHQSITGDIVVNVRALGDE